MSRQCHVIFLAVSDFLSDSLSTDLFVIPRSPAALFGEEVEDDLLVLVEALGVHEPALVAVRAVAGHLHHVAPVHNLGAEAGHLL